ncbi:MAG: hypothetical protein P8P48_12045 [Saprospiraceae bacterium]|nr:hypothetical protein [Saprospiraceae bacterium]
MKIRNFFFCVIPVLLFFTISCENMNSLSEADVDSFLESFFDAQVGGDATIEAYNNTLSDGLMVWANASWGGAPSTYDKGDTEAAWFYEDSITYELHDVMMVGSDASVMGSATWHVAGLKTFGQSFSGIVGMEDGKMVWKRFMGVWTNTLAKDFLWPTTEAEGVMSSYNEMRKHMMELSNEKALAISDSLVMKDPNWATAHLGQLHYYWLGNDDAKLKEVYDIAMSKLEGASIAEQYFIKSYNPAKGADTRGNQRMALLHAPNDPMIRTWYAWGEKDFDAAIDILKKGLDRMPDNTGLNNMIAYKYMYNGDMEQAEKHFKLNTMSSPSMSNGHDSYGDFLLEQGDKEGAKAAFMKAFELDSNFTVSKEKADKIDK